MSFQIEIDKKIKDGSIYFVGDALPSDWYAAFKIWSALAQCGDMKAQLNTGWCYLFGEGIEADRKQANHWLESAAAQNCPKANWYLSRDYFGTDSQSQKAYFEKAVALGDKLAVQHAKMLEKQESDEKKRIAEHNKFLLFRASVDQIIKAFDEQRYDAAKPLLEKMVAEGHHDFGRLRSALESSLVGITAERKNIKGELVRGGIINGTTQIYQEWSQRVEVSFTIKNNGAYPVSIQLRYRGNYSDGDGDGLQPTGEIPPGEQKLVNSVVQPTEASSLLPFFFYECAGHKYRVPLRGYKGTNFPACKKDLKNAGCFVLTACFGDNRHSTVVRFRDFRDTHLANHRLGRSAIKLYYRYGPTAASFIDNKPRIKRALRAAFAIIEQVLPK